MTTHASLKQLLLAVALLAVPVAPALPQDKIDTGINVAGTKAVKIAVTELQFTPATAQAANLARVFNETLWNDLDFSGNLEIASRSTYPLGIFAKPGDIKVEDWTRPLIGAQYIVYGSLSLSSNRLSVHGLMRDLGVEQDSVNNVFPAPFDEEGARTTAHLFADRILEQLGFGKGVARTSIAFSSNRTGGGIKEIYVMDYDGNNQRKLTAIRNLAIAPRWSPVDDRIAFTAWRTGQPQVEIVSSSGEGHGFEQPRGFINNLPGWSPDGKSIVYSSNRDGDNEIYLANADGSNAKRLTRSPGIDTSPAINPATGSQIAFISKRSGTAELYVMDLDGTNVTRITEEGGEVANPSYSSDGKMIAFAWQKPRSGGFDIYLYEVGMRKFTQLTNQSGNNERPTWAPGNKHIAFESNRSGTTQIYSMTVNGSKVRQLTTLGSHNQGPTWSGYAAR